MSLSRLLPVLAQDRALARLLELVTDARAHPLVDVTVADGARPPLIASLLDPLRGPRAGARPGSGAGAPAVVLAVTATTRAAEDLVSALSAYLPGHAVADFPSWETLPHERLSPRTDTVGRRLAVLRRLAHPGDAGAHDGPLSVVVAPVRSLLQPIARGLGDLAPVSLEVGAEYPLEEVVEALVAAAYTRTDLVERRGEFAVRGGVLDIFPPTHDQPLRVEFFGDEVEEIRPFKVADQRSLTVADLGSALPTSLWAPPLWSPRRAGTPRISRQPWPASVIPTGWRSSRAGKPCPTSASAPAPTPWGSASRSCGASLTPTRRTPRTGR